MKRPKQKQGRSKNDRDKFIRVKCKVDSDDNNEGDGSSSDGTETGDCSDDSNGSDDTEMFCEDCKPSKSKKNSISPNSDCSSDSERTSKTRHSSKKKGFSLFVVAAKKTDSESDSDSSDTMCDKKKRKTSNDGCGGGSQKKSKDSKNSGSLRIKKISTDSCVDLDDISCPMKILHRFICQGYEKSKMKCRKSKQSNKDCESQELESEDDCERGSSRRDKKKKSGKRGSSVPAKECRESGKEGSSKKRRSLSCSTDTSGKKTSSKCCQTSVSIDFNVKPKKPKHNSKTRSRSCQTSKHNSAVYSFSQLRKPSVYFMPPDQNPPDKDCAEHFSVIPDTGQMNCTHQHRHQDTCGNCTQHRHQDPCGNDSQKLPGNTVNTLELHVDLGRSHKKQHCSKERETKPQSEENMKWCERTFQDEFKNLVKEFEGNKKPEKQSKKGSSNKKAKSNSKIRSKRKEGIRVEKEASIVLNATDLSMLAQMMVQLSNTQPKC